MDKNRTEKGVKRDKNVPINGQKMDKYGQKMEKMEKISTKLNKKCTKMD